MPSLAHLLKDGGRKYAVVIRTLELGFLLSLVGLLVVAAFPAAAPHVATIVGAFGVLGSVSIAAYQGANAAKDWNNPTTTMTVTTPTPRPSGTVTTPDA